MLLIQYLDESPFYMSDRVNYVPTHFVASSGDRFFGGATQSRLDSENQDLRGVIDDLTIENKRLRQMIRLQQRQRRSTPSDASQQDKLFEVRVHGLPPEKRRELEYLLKNFATSVQSTGLSKSTSTTDKSTGTSSSGRNLGPRADSGYASQSNSGQYSSRMGNMSTSAPKLSTNKAVKNYLQDIPDTLLPKQIPVMSERAKSALVVRRLEQLFVGRNATTGHHDQPMQQQEISQNAARMDRIQDAKDNKKKKPEGTREAHVMPPESKTNLDFVDDVDPKEMKTFLKPPTHTAVPDPATSGSTSPDQRPTRPLDLDIHRAQVAAENIEYIRHLGLTSPQLGETLKDGEENPWIFVNLLAGLAQLHTLNVTPDFIRRAIKKLSKRFELSKDGHKVRWVGKGTEGTKFAVEDEKAIEAVENNPQESIDEAGSGGRSKRSKTNSTSVAALTSTQSEDKTSGPQTSSGSKRQQLTTSGTFNMQSSLSTKPTTSGSAFDYKPILYRAKSRLDDDYFRDSDDSFDSQSGDSSGLAHALSRSNLNQKSKEEGLITFYNTPYFCSDFSSDSRPSNLLEQPRQVIMGETLGTSMPANVIESPLRYHDATYFTSHFAPAAYTPQSKEEEKKLHIDFPTLETISEAGEEETIPLEMEVCGLGGVTPDDNFALDVQVKVGAAPTRGHGVIAKRLPFSGRQYFQKYTWKIKSCQKLELLPSKLPPPSYIFFTSSSSSDALDMEDMSDSDSDSSSSPLVDGERHPPPPFLMQFSGSSGDNACDEADSVDSSEMDVLATARQVNPQQIAEQERVYMINETEGSRRVIAESLAATIGASRSSASNYEAAVIMSSVSDQHGSVDSEDGDDDEEMDDA